MEKLIELFKEYVDKYGTDTKDLEKEYGVIDDGQGFLYGTREYNYLTLISKSFGFIKWLVDNDKIDLDKVEEKSDLIEYLIGTPTKVYENIIMILAIQDEPIRFLCEIIK